MVRFSKILKSFNVILLNKNSYNFILKDKKNLVIDSNLIKIDNKTDILKYIKKYNINFYVNYEKMYNNKDVNGINNIISNH